MNGHDLLRESEEAFRDMKYCGICRALFEIDVEKTPEHMDCHTMRNTDPAAQERQREIIARAVAAKENKNV